MNPNAQCALSSPAPPMLQDRQTLLVHPKTRLFGDFVLEVVKPSEDSERPVLPGWAIHVWPVARLGDVPLEVRPLLTSVGPDELLTALRNEGCIPLGQVRLRQGQVQNIDLAFADLDGPRRQASFRPHVLHFQSVSE